MSDNVAENARKKRKYLVDDPREPVIMRIRMKRGLLNRIHRIVGYDRERTHRSWNMSDAIREILLPWVDRREGEIRSVELAGPFLGEVPGLVPGEEDGAAIKVRRM